MSCSNCPYCLHRYVLVVHDDFKTATVYFRRTGDDMDVANLRRAFANERNCHFAELANCSSAEILAILSDWQRLSALFGHESDLQPAEFFLFVLSHGEEGGVVLTSHPSKTIDARCFDSYSTSDIWNALDTIPALKLCPKIIFLAPCRGASMENRMSTEFMSIQPSNHTPPGWLSSKPNIENFAILYSTIETTYANRDESLGTWLVQAVCQELAALREDTLLLLFLTRVQSNVCHRFTLDNARQCQTPQLQLFACSPVFLCASHRHRHTSGTVADGVQVDAQAVNAESVSKMLFYNWRDAQGAQLRRGKALIFHDEFHATLAAELAVSFETLQYKTKLSDATVTVTTIASRRFMKSMTLDGSVAVCVLAKLREDPIGGLVFLASKDKAVPLGAVVNAFSGDLCPHLQGRPKLFFFLDKGVTEDSMHPITQNQNVEGLQFQNWHAGSCIFVGSGAGSRQHSGGLIQDVALALRLPKLCNLQDTLVQLMEKSPDAGRDVVRPQMVSTLPLLLDFPHQQKPHKQLRRYTKCRLLLLAGLAAVIIAMVCLFSTYINTRNMNINFTYEVDKVNENCSGLIQNIGSWVDSKQILKLEIGSYYINMSLDTLAETYSTCKHIGMDLVTLTRKKEMSEITKHLESGDYWVAAARVNGSILPTKWVEQMLVPSVEKPNTWEYKDCEICFYLRVAKSEATRIMLIDEECNEKKHILCKMSSLIANCLTPKFHAI